MTITDCQLDANKDSGLFSTYLGDKGETTVSNIRVANVTVDGLEVNRAHPFVAYFAYDTYAYNADSTAFTARYPKTYENVTFENISMDAAVNYSGYTAEPAKMLPDLVPQAKGVTLKNSVMVYHQGADYALFTEDTLDGVYSNVYVVRDLADADPTVIYIDADGTRSEAAVAVPAALSLQVGETSEEALNIELTGASLSYESSDENVAQLLEDGRIQAVGAGKASILVLVEVTEQSSLPLLEVKVSVEGPNKDALSLRYDECIKAAEDEFYTEETRQALQQAAAKAKLVLDSPSATQQDVDNALAELEAVAGQLIPADYHLESLVYEGRANVTVYASEAANAIETFAVTEPYFEARNKINMGGDEIGTQIIDGVKYNLAGSIINSGTATLWIDKYFDEHPEYFMTDKFGEPLRSQYGSNLNFYSMEAAEALAAELIALSEKQGSNIVDHGIQDNQHFCMIVDDGEGGKVDLASLPPAVLGSLPGSG